MKILCINDLVSVGGAASFTRSACNNLARFGNEVHLVYGLNDARDKLSVNAQMHQGVTIRHVSELSKEAANAFAHSGVAMRTLGSEAINQAITDLIQAEQYDAVYILNLHQFFSIRLIPGIRNIFGGPIIFQYNDNDLFCVRKYNYINEQRRACRECLKDPESAVRQACWNDAGYDYFTANLANRRDGYYKRAIESIDTFLVTSESSREILQTMGVEPAHILLIHNSVDVANFTPGPVRNNFIFYGWAILTKGIEILASALQMAQIESFDFYLLSVHPQLQEFLERISTERKFTIKIHTDITWQNGLFDRVGSCRAVVVPSQWDTPTEMVISESVSLGRALITSHYSARTPLVQENKNALVFPATDPKALAECLTKLAADPNLATQFGQNSRRIAEDELTPEKWYETFMKALTHCHSANKAVTTFFRHTASQMSKGVDAYEHLARLRAELSASVISDSLQETRLSEKTNNGLYDSTLKEHSPSTQDIHIKAGELNKQGTSLFAKGDTEGALNLFTKAVELNPNFAGAHNNLAILYWQTGHPQKAAEHFSKALQIDPNDRNTVINCTELLKFHNRIEDAKTLCSSYLQRNPGDAVITEALRSLET